MTLGFLAILMIPLALALYALKSVAGIDLVPGDGGLYGLRESLAQQIGVLLK